MTILRQGGVISDVCVTSTMCVCVCVCVRAAELFCWLQELNLAEAASTSAIWDGVNEDKGGGEGGWRGINPTDYLHTRAHTLSMEVQGCHY